MKIAIVVLDGVQALDIAGALDVFAEANKCLRAACQYQVSLIGERAGPIACSNSMQLSVPFDYTAFRTSVDVLLVTGRAHASNCRPKRDFLDWLRERALQSKRIGSICNGAFLLGQAGVLNGREVSASWADASSLAREFPLARIRPDRVLIRDGNLVSCAGATAGWHLCLSQVADDWGHEFAARIATRLGMDMDQEGRPYIDPAAGKSTLIEKVQRYVNEHIADELSIEQLASAVSVSRRSFSRLFAKHAQTTPSAFVEELRVDAARKILGETDDPLKTVAFKCGFHNATHMRMVFLRRINVTPMQYRQQKRGGQSVHGMPRRMHRTDRSIDFEATA
ncbi:GlxA family transcriptional regulator [Paraburkholderia terrae]|jgi:transcriptional regulator GlxA family with amidase domain|uniref:GlxA family transcriptional regulator n=1 Tax=Paraburkholderia terrae TaxID=311230 RepID=UPI001EE176AE|nr:helix-turn-helix domain-containing protein [Paraburkholderia terrae]GJG99777.1 helix-turn-helix domain-containing protein [Paraburkholderia terrae]GJH32507.1 helix-turn-helix domain-containing protein [Paraburkholderia hospita]